MNRKPPMNNHYSLIDEVKNYDAVILANGAFPTAEAALRLLCQAPFVCACDGAVEAFPEADAVVGDGDSLSDIFLSRLVRVTEQEDNDLTKATRHCLSLGMHRIVYLGATGLREDHTIGNFSLMARYAAEMEVEPLLATDYGWLVVARGNASFESLPGQQVSIFNLDCSTLVSEGLRWASYPYRQLWQGTLNEALGTSFSLRGDGSYMVYRTYKKKISKK